MASPSIVAETPSNDDNDTTSFTILTGSPLEGEGSLIFLSRDNGGTGTVTWSDGYTELYDLNDDDGFSSGAAAYKQAGASEPSSITVTASVSGEFTARAYRISGHLSFATQAPDVGTVTNGGNTVTHNPPSVNVTGGAADILSFAVLPFDTHNSDVNTYPSSYINTGVTRSGVSGSQCSLAFCTRAITSVSSEDPGAFTLSATRRGIPTTVLVQAEAAGGSAITANVAEAGDTTDATLEVTVSVSANVTEAGDTASAALATIVSITANLSEAGDTTSAALNNIVSINANQTEAGDTTTAALSVVGVSQITANVAEAGDTTTATLATIVSITANVAEAGDSTAAAISTGAALIAATADIGIFPAYSGQSGITPAYIGKVDIL